MEDWELKAREQIRHLAARYNAFGDSGRFENVMALFAEDAVVEVVGHQTYRGHAQLRLTTFLYIGAQHINTTAVHSRRIDG
ncbi:MAG: nuclear transport factor 2 family protein [Planctomycetota bacterium]|nr:nuclear transport factor 2 family protein [Planctomycetota bacterium]